MVLVIAEQKDGVLNRASWEAVAAAQQMGGPITVVVPGASVSGPANELAAADVAGVIALEHDALGAYTPDGFVAALAALIGTEAPSHVVLPHTYQTRDFAPKLAVRLNAPLVADCVGLKSVDGAHVYVRLMFQGKVNADVVIDGPGPHIVTFQVGAFRVDAVRKGSAAAAVRQVAAQVDPAAIRQTPEAPFREAKQAVDLTQAERIVSVGRGIKGPEHIELAKQLAEALQAELAASRPICDAGWLPMERQVGSSGQTVAPKLYLALGISGAIQHVVGMKGTRTIVAINKDAEAPIFEIADYGIVGDLFDVVPAVIAALKT
ncbi:MAG: electron transfer flavoprotein subunit alpha/FixB family protein [Acidimicrobiia bacterium]|nr:electron transfer flavoprotein subunit alpha/FixB family protein [Acidimicrobiia bacterium]